MTRTVTHLVLSDPITPSGAMGSSGFWKLEKRAIGSTVLYKDPCYCSGLPRTSKLGLGHTKVEASGWVIIVVGNLEVKFELIRSRGFTVMASETTNDRPATCNWTPSGEC